MREKELKLKYNYFIKRVDKAQKFFEKCKEIEVDRYMPEFLRIVKELDKIGHEIEKITGRTLTTIEVLEGFK